MNGLRRRRYYYQYSLRDGVRRYPTRAWLMIRLTPKSAAFILLSLLLVVFGSGIPLTHTKTAAAVQHVPGQDYQICDETAQYLTSPWTYDALASGSQSYTVAQYEALSGYGTTLPPLPSYIAGEPSSTEAAVIYAPGSSVSQPSYNLPNSPVLSYFEGGAYTGLTFASVSGDEFIGGTSPGYPEPTFNDGGAADGINAQNATYAYSGGSSALAVTATAGATTLTTTTAIPGYISYLTFADGSTYSIASNSGTSITLGSGLTGTESAGTAVWANRQRPIAAVTLSAAHGAGSVTVGASSIPLVKYGHIVIGADSYTITGITGSQSGYTVSVAGLDTDVSANTPAYYDDLSGGVTVEYLDINNDQHLTTGTIYTGSGWTIEHNNIHDGYSSGPGYGVAIYGGDEGTIEYNCLSKMGDYGINAFGDNAVFDYNEVYETNYARDPGCGCSGAGKWWGTLNADINNNAFVNDGPGGSITVWLDNGNTGTQISGNYFSMSYSSAISAETGYNLEVTNNLFEDGGWGNGTGPSDSNGVGSVSLNHTGGWDVPGSRYENEVLISDNQFINDWGGVAMWQSGARSCENSGEGWPDDAAYCSGGYPNTAATASADSAASGKYYFSHTGDSAHGGEASLAQGAAAGSSTVLVTRAEAINDQIGFADPVSTTTTSTASVTTLSNATLPLASTAGFSATGGKARVGTSAAWSDAGGSYTGAVLTYTGVSGNSLTGVTLATDGSGHALGKGTLAGPVQAVQPYKVTAETCYANACKVTLGQPLAQTEAAGAAITNAGTCQLFATSTATPTAPLAPDSSTSYWDGCQWEVRDVSVTGNTFAFDPSVIAGADGQTLPGGATTTTCESSNTCGTNFMAYQQAGEAPFGDNIGGDMMLSQSALTGCPSWDSGCSTNPLANLNSPPAALASNGASAGDNVWSANTYTGGWKWNAYSYGGCSALPKDLATGKSMPAGSCSTISLATWQSSWQQDLGSIANAATPPAVSITSLADGDTIHGNAVSVVADATANDGGSVTGATLSVDGHTVRAASGAPPYTFSLSTLGYPDGSHTVTVSASDDLDDVGISAVTVYVTNGDFNGDRKVNITDLSILAGHWGSQSGATFAQGDTTGDGKINLPDLSVLGSNWNKSW